MVLVTIRWSLKLEDFAIQRKQSMQCKYSDDISPDRDMNGRDELRISNRRHHDIPGEKWVGASDNRLYLSAVE